ncbi:integrase domain-containing protein [Cupriavidus sp. CuC1]|uniref:integrase domain-containing protein n=1 Tax=Cupriavidus sp. CuC1 TaxID=3373131 RepID=UPI0037CDA106
MPAQTIINLRPILAVYSLPERFKSEFAILAADNLHKPHSVTRASGRALSALTQQQRAQALLAMMVELRKGGMTVMSPYNVRVRHVRWLVRHWILERKLNVATVEGRLSHLRAMCAGWMGKVGMVGKPEDYVELPEGYRRSYVATKDRSWEGNGVDAEKVVLSIARTDSHVSMQVRLEAAFGLRAKESWRLRPARDLLPTGYLHVQDGTKGGLPRQIPIEFGWQYDLLVEAAELAAKTNPERGSLIPAEYSQKKWRRRFYTVLEKHGVTKHGEHGVTAHGLRHGYFHQMYERLTGERAAIKGGDRITDAAVRDAAMRRIVAAAGHSRLAKAGMYLSSHARMASEVRPRVTVEMAVEAVKQANGVKLHAAKALGISRTSLYRLLETAQAAAGDTGDI